jgi:hypothetical protein
LLPSYSSFVDVVKERGEKKDEIEKKITTPPMIETKVFFLCVCFFSPSNSKVPNLCLGSIPKGILNQKHVKRTS